MLSLALGAQSGLLRLPYLASPLPYTVVSGPRWVAAPERSIAVHASLHPVPIVSTYAAPVVTTYHSVPIPAQGDYIAKTRGSLHVAPLPGHINSVRSINLEPAPGTL